MLGISRDKVVLFIDKSHRVENVLQIQTLNGIRMSAKPEVVMGKILEDTTLLNFLCSEVCL